MKANHFGRSSGKKLGLKGLRPVWKALFAVSALLFIGAAVFPMFRAATNCGGNSAALAHVHNYALLANAGTGIPAGELRAQRSEFCHNHWLSAAHFLVSTIAVQPHETKRIIIVCDTSYRNVPRRFIGSAPATHAAGFSDGSAALISSAEFASLDHSHFIALDELYLSNSK